MASLLSLPPELVYLLLRTWLFERQYLLTLCLIPFFRGAAMHLLYSLPVSRDMHRLLSTILRNSDLDLGDYVSRLEVSIRFSGPPNDVRLYLESAESIDCEHSLKALWLQALRAGDAEAVLALLLFRLPRLQHLTINSDPGNGLAHDQFDLSRFIPSIPFSKLQTLCLKGLCVYPPTVAVLLKIPTLRRFHLTGTSESYGYRMDLSPGCSGVEEIILDNVCIALSSVTRIILSCKTLKRFTFQRPTENCITPKLPLLIQALKKFTHSLEELRIRYFRSPRLPAGTCSLSEFRRLRIVACDATILVHDATALADDPFDQPLPLNNAHAFLPLSDLLPRSIEKLHIHSLCIDFWDFYEGDEFLPNLDTGFPYLREVKLVHGCDSRKTEMVRSINCYDGQIQFSLEEFARSALHFQLLEDVYSAC